MPAWVSQKNDKLYPMIHFAQRLIFIAAPILVMIGLIPIIHNDLLLSLIYIVITAATLLLSGDRKDYLFFAFGFILLSIAEVFFVSTGVEVFDRDVLILNIPIWLPLIWGYSFVMIRRSIVALEDYLK